MNDDTAKAYLNQCRPVKDRQDALDEQNALLVNLTSILVDSYFGGSDSKGKSFALGTCRVVSQGVVCQESHAFARVQSEAATVVSFGTPFR
jgi:hypothetical protein